MTQTDFSEFSELEYDGEPMDVEEEEDGPSFEDVQQTIDGRRADEEAWRQKEKERLLKHIPELGG